MVTEQGKEVTRHCQWHMHIWEFFWAVAATHQNCMWFFPARACCQLTVFSELWQQPFESFFFPIQLNLCIIYHGFFSFRISLLPLTHMCFLLFFMGFMIQRGFSRRNTTILLGCFSQIELLWMTTSQGHARLQRMIRIGEKNSKRQLFCFTKDLAIDQAGSSHGTFASSTGSRFGQEAIAVEAFCMTWINIYRLPLSWFVRRIPDRRYPSNPFLQLLKCLSLKHTAPAVVPWCSVHML